MRVQILVEDWVEMNKAALERIEQCKKDNLCVACLQSLEGEKRVVRGCHEKCYQATKRAIKKKAFTEIQRISEGKLLPSDPGGRPISNPITKEALANS